MAQYIDKSAVVAEIEKRVKEGEIVARDVPSSAIFGLIQAYKNILSFLDTLEIKEVDLDNHEDIKNSFKAGFELGYEHYLKTKRE